MMSEQLGTDRRTSVEIAAGGPNPENEADVITLKDADIIPDIKVTEKDIFTDDKQAEIQNRVDALRDKGVAQVVVINYLADRAKLEKLRATIAHEEKQAEEHETSRFAQWMDKAKEYFNEKDESQERFEERQAIEMMKQHTERQKEIELLEETVAAHGEAIRDMAETREAYNEETGAFDEEMLREFIRRDSFREADIIEQEIT